MAKKKKDLKKSVVLPKNVSAKMQESVITITGPKGEVTKLILDPKIQIELSNGSFVVKPVWRSSQKEKVLINAFVAHIRNMIKGVTGSHVYELKICSSHFPMNVTVQNDEVIVKNLVGEKIPRKVRVRKNTKVKVEGTAIMIESVDKEAAGQMAADIEKLTRIKNKDRRVFQDGIFIVVKDGKAVA